MLNTNNSMINVWLNWKRWIRLESLISLIPMEFMDGKRVEILITCLKPSISTHLSSVRLLFNLLENTVRLKTIIQSGIAQMMVNLFLWDLLRISLITRSLYLILSLHNIWTLSTGRIAAHSQCSQKLMKVNGYISALVSVHLLLATPCSTTTPCINLRLTNREESP